MSDGEPVDAPRVADIVRTQFPDVRAAAVAYLGEGCDSQAFEVDARWVFRFPKRRDVEQQLLREARVLPVLSKQSPIPIPAFCFHGTPSAAFRRHFAGYPKIPGVPALTLEPGTSPFSEWAPVLARFLSWLHSFPVEEAVRLGVERANGARPQEEAFRDALDDLENVRRVSPGPHVDAWQAYLSVPPPMGGDPHSAVLVHGDLAAEHVLCDTATMTLTGVIDWSEMAIDDRSVDLAALFHWGGQPFVDAVLATYASHVEDAMLARARYLAACRGAADVTFGLETNRPEYVEGGLRALAQCIR